MEWLTEDVEYSNYGKVVVTGSQYKGMDNSIKQVK